MRFLLTTVLGVLLVGATVIGIVSTTQDHSQRPSVGSSQSGSGLVLYGGR